MSYDQLSFLVASVVLLWILHMCMYMIFFCFRASAIFAIDSPMLCETLFFSVIRDLGVQGQDVG